MTEQKLYAFFCAEHYDGSLEEIEINIDSSLSYIGDIYHHFGKIVYKDYPYDNPIWSGNKYFFGGSPDGFFDCLTDYLDLRNTEVTLRVNVSSVGEHVTDKELFLFLYVICAAMDNYDYDSRLRVFVTKEIIKIYRREAGRLIELDTKPEDYELFLE